MHTETMKPRSFRMNYAETLKPVFERHSIPEALHADIVRFFTELEPVSPELAKFKRKRVWKPFIYDARVTVGEQFLEDLKNGKR